MRVVVTRPVLFGGNRKEVGDILDLPDAQAIESISTGRTKRAPAEKPAPAGPMTTATAPALAPGKVKAKKGDSNVVAS